MRLIQLEFDEKNLGKIAIDADKIGSYIREEDDHMYRLTVLVAGGLWLSWGYTTRAGRDDAFNAFIGTDNTLLQSCLNKCTERRFGFGFTATDFNNFRGVTV